MCVTSAWETTRAFQINHTRLPKGHVHPAWQQYGGSREQGWTVSGAARHRPGVGLLTFELGHLAKKSKLMEKTIRSLVLQKIINALVKVIQA